MGNLRHRLLHEHSIGKLALGQFLMVFAFLVLSPPAVHEVYSWEVSGPFSMCIVTDDDLKAGPNPLASNVTEGLSNEPIRIHEDDLCWTVEVRFYNGSASDDTDTIVVRSAPIEFPYLPFNQPQPESTWADIGTVELRRGVYEIWVAKPATNDGRVNYRVMDEDGQYVEVVQPRDEVTRRMMGHTFHLDSRFTIEERGEYRMEANRAALRQSYYMAVLPERSMAYPFVLSLGLSLVLLVVVSKSFRVYRGWTERKAMARKRDLYAFPADTAYFFAMGPESNWKGPPFFRFPRGTADFFDWTPMSLEFPEGTAGFFDLGPEGPRKAYRSGSRRRPGVSRHGCS
jgi:hypothetical protein